MRKVVIILAERREQALVLAQDLALRPEQWYHATNMERLVGWRDAKVLVLDTALRHPEYENMMRELEFNRAEFIHFPRPETPVQREHRMAALTRVFKECFGYNYRIKNQA